MKLSERQIALRSGLKNHGLPHIWFANGRWHCCQMLLGTNFSLYAFNQANLFISIKNCILEENEND